MSLEFNVGEIVSRVRRALAVRGRAPLDLDERLALNVTALDIDRAPFRSEGARWYGGYNFAASPGNFTAIMVSTVSFTAQATHVIDGLWLTNQEAANNQYFRLGNYPTIATGFEQLCRYPEMSNGTNSNLPRGPARISSFFGGAAQLTDATSDITMLVPAGQTVYVPLEVTIVPSAIGVLSWGVETTIINRAFAAYFTGRSFPPGTQQR